MLWGSDRELSTDTALRILGTLPHRVLSSSRMPPDSEPLSKGSNYTFLPLLNKSLVTSASTLVIFKLEVVKGPSGGNPKLD